MKFSHRFFLYAPVAAVGVLFVVAAIYWTVAAHTFSKRLDALNGHEIAPGVVLHFATKSIGGFPFRVDAVLQDMRIDMAGAHGPAGWRAQEFALHMLDYSAASLVFEAAGQQIFSWRDAKGAPHSLAFVPGLLRASASMDGGELKRFDLELIGMAGASFRVARGEFHVRRTPHEGAFDLALTADDVHLAPDERTAAGDVISKLRLNATLGPAGGWNALLSGKGDWRSAADGWRTHSGALDIARIEIAWGNVNALGSGLLMLDGARRLLGLVKLGIAGADVLADEAAKRHLMRGPQASLFDGLMAAAASSKTNPAARLPVTLAFKDGLSYVNETPAGFLSPVY